MPEWQSDEWPNFLVRLREREAVASRCLEFLILTAAGRLDTIEVATLSVGHLPTFWGGEAELANIRAEEVRIFADSLCWLPM